MRIFLRDLQAIEVRSGPRVRFSVTVAEDDGEPFLTEKGWTMDSDRELWVPHSRTVRGMYLPMVEAAPIALERIKAGLVPRPEIERILGPVVEGTKVNRSGNEVIKIDLEV